MCSALPVYLLLCLARTNRKYTCEKCCRDKYADQEWTAEAVAAIKNQRQSLVSNSTISPLDQSDPIEMHTQGDSSQDHSPSLPNPTLEMGRTRKNTNMLELGTHQRTLTFLTWGKPRKRPEAHLPEHIRICRLDR